MGIAETDNRSVTAAGQLKRQRGALPADEIHVSTPATIATTPAAIGASSFTLMTASAVRIDRVSAVEAENRTELNTTLAQESRHGIRSPGVDRTQPKAVR